MSAVIAEREAAYSLIASPRSLWESSQSSIAVLLEIISAQPDAISLKGAFAIIPVSAIIAEGGCASSETAPFSVETEALDDAMPSCEAAGARVLDLISESGCNTEVFMSESISIDSINEAQEAAKSHDFIIGVGGGRVIDLAKVVSYNLDQHFISVPTAASHDGIASSRASVSTEKGAVSLDAQPPSAIIADTGIIAKAPFRLMASGCADIISNRTAILDWELSHRLRGEAISEYAASLSAMTADILVRNAGLIKPGSEEAAWIVTKALVSSGVAMSIAGSSRPASGGEHKFSHALDILAPGKGLHGEQCGIGSIMTMYLHGGGLAWPQEFAQGDRSPGNPCKDRYRRRNCS